MERTISLFAVIFVITFDAIVSYKTDINRSYRNMDDLLAQTSKAASVMKTVTDKPISEAENKPSTVSKIDIKDAVRILETLNERLHMQVNDLKSLLPKLDVEFINVTDTGKIMPTN